MAVVIDTQGQQHILQCKDCKVFVGYNDTEVVHHHPEDSGIFHQSCGLTLSCPSCGSENHVAESDRHDYLSGENASSLIELPPRFRFETSNRGGLIRSRNKRPPLPNEVLYGEYAD